VYVTSLESWVYHLTVSVLNFHNHMQDIVILIMFHIHTRYCLQTQTQYLLQVDKYKSSRHEPVQTCTDILFITQCINPCEQQLQFSTPSLDNFLTNLIPVSGTMFKEMSHIFVCRDDATQSSNSA